MVNNSQTPVTKFQLKFRQNLMGISPIGNLSVGTLKPGETKAAPLKLQSAANYVDDTKTMVDMAIKTELGVAMFADTIPARIFFSENGKVSAQGFVPDWKALGASAEKTNTLTLAAGADLKSLITKLQQPLEAERVFHIATRNAKETSYFSYYSLSCRAVSVLLEIALKDGQAKISTRSSDTNLAAAVLADVCTIVSPLLVSSPVKAASGGAFFDAFQ
eukprot:gb/GEZN01010323.1/.p1 GENE.gb/GEZN01010323.1/~~gb/GEZN01010323.1/.p1  ORF type:complete len:218 (+),score=38.20 gb/GEZN01010323.1/:461-1114(+)